MFEHGFQAVGFFNGEVLGFGGILGEVVEFGFAEGSGFEVVLHEFPIAHTEGAAALDFVEFPVKRFVGLLLIRFAEQGGSIGNALDA